MAKGLIIHKLKFGHFFFFQKLIEFAKENFLNNVATLQNFHTQKKKKEKRKKGWLVG
jgi:hypothetical protein